MSFEVYVNVYDVCIFEIRKTKSLEKIYKIEPLVHSMQKCIFIKLGCIQKIKQRR